MSFALIINEEHVGVAELMHTAPVRSKAPTGLAPRRPVFNNMKNYF